ncbi:N-acetylmuramoyl-L-alanine amidase [Halobacillus litoralis]|uniref:N-acetylmuramoyl-L-alanine amidase n=1 Tax=Halobacillus litoralis TaxID=45668 RepID=A0A845E0G8_9BACI|nr:MULTISPECIES: N-acetylmuramoyl-L-alanine amidase [Halobacillus]MYL22052.1 N-acetylmuramoyl-L-alanine amidase [Halobacillus litoralis]MYL31961.1 N-acetylmuramoyl-L-alanine amidase [Halobacillus halophilus]MYL39973.1 N-acetylmuramoyl-L-alanine amidase [Halobacillus litoralis]
MSAKVILDPGHGGHDQGASGNGLKEKDVVLKIAKYTNEILENNYEEVETRLTRKSDYFVDLLQRSEFANEWGADYFVSFHINAFDGSAQGFESYIYNGLPEDSKAEKFQNALHEEILKEAKYFYDRGLKEANFSVLRETNMPAILTENGFIDSEKDAKHLKSNEDLRNVALGHAKGIAEIAGLNLKDSNEKKKSEVVAGTFSNYENAQNKGEILSDQGVDNYVRKSGNYFEVVAGTFENNENAKDMVITLKNFGIDSYVKQ